MIDFIGCTKTEMPWGQGNPNSGAENLGGSSYICDHRLRVDFQQLYYVPGT